VSEVAAVVAAPAAMAWPANMWSLRGPTVIRSVQMCLLRLCVGKEEELGLSEV
jgi:hypothetical protein